MDHSVKDLRNWRLRIDREAAKPTAAWYLGERKLDLRGGAVSKD